MQRILNFRELIELAGRRWARPGQLSFVRFPERELVFTKARELESDTDVKVY